jgi:hypothetical protein
VGLVHLVDEVLGALHVDGRPNVVDGVSLGVRGENVKR